MFYQCVHVCFFLHAQNGGSPLYFASQYGHTEVVDVLLNAGADVHQATTKVHYLHCMYVYFKSLTCLVVFHKVGHYFHTLKKQTLSNPMWNWKTLPHRVGESLSL